MENINTRIQIIINELYNSNVSEFERASGIKPYTIKNIVGSRQTKPSYDILELIIRNNVQISAEWLLCGKGKMLKKEQSSNHVGANSRIGANYQGNFAEPINTIIGDSKKGIGHIGGDVKGDNNNVGITSFSNDKELFKAKQETDYLKREIKSLKDQLKQAIIEKERAIVDKDRAMSMLEKALRK